MRLLMLNSAHGKYPAGSEGWIQALAHAIRETASEGTTFICSTEPIPWDLAAYLAGQSCARTEIIIKSPETSRSRAEFTRLLEDFGMDERRTKPVYLKEHPASLSHPKDCWQSRDRVALALADIVYPVSIRPGGRLDHMLEEPSFRGKVRDDFRIAWSETRLNTRYFLTGRTWNPLPPGDWLTHWTRARPGKWPGERSYDFFRDMLGQPETYVRSAEETLLRIVREGRIRGSSWKTPGGSPLVAFTALSLGDAQALMRWRKRFVRYSFEPYGVAIRKEALIRLGASAVAYDHVKNEAGSSVRVFTHAPGKDDHWAAEREWRLQGDLLLNDIPTDSVCLITPDDLCAEKLEKCTEGRYPVHALFRNYT